MILSCWMMLDVEFRNLKGLSHGVPKFANPMMPNQWWSRNATHCPVGLHHCQLACNPIRGSRPLHMSQLAMGQLTSKSPDPKWLLEGCFSIALKWLSVCFENMNLSFSNLGIPTTPAGAGPMICMATSKRKKSGRIWLYFGFLMSHLGQLCWNLPSLRSSKVSSLHLSCKIMIWGMRFWLPICSLLQQIQAGFQRRPTGQGKRGCKNIRLGGDTVDGSPDNHGAHMCYLVYRSFKFKPTWSILSCSKVHAQVLTYIYIYHLYIHIPVHLKNTRGNENHGQMSIGFWLLESWFTCTHDASSLQRKHFAWLLYRHARGRAKGWGSALLFELLCYLW